ENALCVAEATGDVRVAQANARRSHPAVPGERLSIRDTVRTGRRAEAVLTMGDGSRLFLDGGTNLGVREIGLRKSPEWRLRSFFLNGGSVYSHVEHQMPQQFAMLTPVATATVHGTDFVVRVQESGEMVTGVIEGEVEVSNHTGGRRLSSGQMVRVS